jgi:hypothetical protein
MTYEEIDVHGTRMFKRVVIACARNVGFK